MEDVFSLEENRHPERLTDTIIIAKESAHKRLCIVSREGSNIVTYVLKKVALPARL
tara:strand:- start:6616 stop:6783 length:168 start_codon:yes stop_codon:yes gene_type:complete